MAREPPLRRGDVERFVGEAEAVPVDLELGRAGAEVAHKDCDLAVASKAKDGQRGVIGGFEVHQAGLTMTGQETEHLVNGVQAERCGRAVLVAVHHSPRPTVSK